MSTFNPLSGGWRRISHLLVVALFVGISLWVLLVYCGPPLLNWYTTRSWVPVEARIESVDAQRRGDLDGEIYRVTATYRYRFDGLELSSKRVLVTDGFDRSMDAQRRWYERLRDDMERGAPLTVYVDPQDPTDLTLERDIRWDDMMFPVLIAVFGFAGALEYALKLRKEGRSRRVPTAASVGPGAAMTSLADPTRRTAGRLGRQHGFEIVSDGGDEFRKWTVALAVWMAIWVAILSFFGYEFFTGSKEAAQGEIEKFAILALATVGAGLVGLYKSVKLYLSWRRFGRLTLVLDSYPGAIGGEVAAYVDIPVRYNRDTAWRATLACLYRVKEARKGASPGDRVEWQASGVPHAEPSPGPIAHAAAGPDRDSRHAKGGTRLSVRFAVPAGLPPSEPPAPARYLWCLTFALKGRLPGVNLDRSFEIEMQP